MAINASHTVGRADLAGAIMEYLADESMYVGNLIFPTVGVNKKAANLPVVTRESLTQYESQIERNTDGEYPSTTFQTEDLAYACTEKGIEIPIDDAQAKELESSYGIPVEQIAVQKIAHVVLRKHEAMVAAAVFDPDTSFTGGHSNYTDYSGASPWTTTSSNVLAQIQVAQEAVQAATGMIPMHAVMNFRTLNLLKQNTLIQGQMSSNEDNSPLRMAAMMAPMLGLEKIYVAMAGYNTTPGQGTYVNAKFWSNLYCNVFVNDENGQMLSPRLGCTPLWTSDSPQILTMEEYYSDEKRGRRMRCRSTWQAKLIDYHFGYLLKVAAS